MGCKRVQLIDDNPGTRDILPPAVDLTYGSIPELKTKLAGALGNKWCRTNQEMAYSFSKDYTWDKFCEKILKEVQ